MCMSLTDHAQYCGYGKNKIYTVSKEIAHVVYAVVDEKQQFGCGTGDILLYEVQCNGGESRLQDCNCSFIEDFGSGNSPMNYSVHIYM